MKILLSTIIFLIPLSISAELVCPSLGGCPIIWETGICVGCVEKIVKTSPTFTDSQKPVKENTDVIDPYQLAYPTAPEQNLLTSSIHHFAYNKLIGRSLPNEREPKTKMVKIVPFSKKKLPFMVNRNRTRIALCKSGCASSRWATMGFFRDGFYWIRK